MLNRQVIRFALFGALGFGVGAAIETFITLTLYMFVPFPLSFLVIGAVGGASLGLAMKDIRKTVVLAILGALGFIVGVLTATTIASFFDYASLLLGAIAGMVIGAAVGLAFRSLRRIAVLAAAGGVGFGVGLAAGDLLRASMPMVRGVGSIAVAGIIGGAVLGAALGYLESRRSVQERRPPHTNLRNARRRTGLIPWLTRH